MALAGVGILEPEGEGEATLSPNEGERVLSPKEGDGDLARSPIPGDEGFSNVTAFAEHGTAFEPVPQAHVKENQTPLSTN